MAATQACTILAKKTLDWTARISFGEGMRSWVCSEMSKQAAEHAGGGTAAG